MIRILFLLAFFLTSDVFAQAYSQKETDSIAIWANTDEDGSGTDTQPITDADGHLQVDILTGGGAGTQHSEDDAHTTGDEGSMCLAVRNDSASSLCGTDGDYCPLNTDSSGALRVTGGGGGTEYTTNAVAPTDPVGTTVVAERDDALSTLSEAEGDWTNTRATAEGAIWTQDANSDAILADTASIDTNVSTLAGAVSGSEVQVDIVSGASGVENVISTDNSTTSTLAGGATYTGTWEDVSAYSSIAINVFADVDSANDGMMFQFSSDGSNADDVYDFTLDASQSTDRRFQFPVTAQYFRAVYENGAGAQSAFRLQTILHRNPIRTSIHRVDDVVTTDRSAELVKAVIAAKIAEGAEAITGTTGEYQALSMTGWRELRTRDQRALDLANCNDHTDYTVLGDDTDNKADSVDHVFGTGAITFDKVNGTANTVFAGVQDTITTVDLSERFEGGAFVELNAKIPSLSNVDYVFLRVGTDSSNYNEWTWPDTDLTAGGWMELRASTASPSNYAGNGWNDGSVSYVAFGVAFDSQSNTLSGIVFDSVGLVGGRVTDTTTSATISSEISTPNVDLRQVGNTNVDVNTGNASAGTLRVVLASDQPVVSVDDNAGSLTVDGTVTVTDGAGALNVIVDSSALPSGASTAANQSTANGLLTTIDADTGGILADTAAIQTAVETLDNIVSGSEAQVDIVSSALPSGASTAANQSTIIGHVDGIETLLGTIDTDTGAISTNSSTIAGAVSGSEMQVDVLTMPTTTVQATNLDIRSLQETEDVVVAALDSSRIMNDTTAVTPQFAAISAASSGDNTLIAAVASTNLRVLSAFIICTSAVTVRFEDGAGGTALTGQMSLAANAGFVLPYNPHGWFQTSDNTLLNLELSSAVQCSGALTYGGF